MLDSHRLPAIFGALLWLTCLGCERIMAPTGLLEQAAPESHLSSQKLRTLLIDYVPRFASQVEQSADRILAESTDPHVRHHALMWKAYAIPACFRAASRQDPLGAYLDVWVLNKQMTALFERTDTPPPFGPWQPLAIETSRRLEEPIRQIYTTLGVPMSLGDDFVTRFAAAHPVADLYFDRPSLANDYIQQVDVPREELMQVAGALSDDLNELRKLTALYADFIPKQARWQAELLMEGALARGPMAAALADATVAARAADRVAAMTETVPQLIAHERQALQSIVAGERQHVLAELERMRLETLAAVRAEREVVLATFHQERVETGEALQLAGKETLVAAEGLIQRRAEQVIAGGHGVVDRTFDRALQLLALVIGAGFVLLLGRTLAPRFLPSRPSPATENMATLHSIFHDEQQPPRAAA